jgi:uncharacterized membrane protein
MNRWLIYNIALTLAALAVSLYLGLVRPDLFPDRVPIHWGSDGKANQFVDRHDVLPYLLIVPGLMAGFVLLALALPWLSPQQFSIERFRRTYNFLMALLLTLFGYIHLMALAGSMELDIDTTKGLLGGMFLFFALLGNMLGKVQRNFFVGIRTPWTLADETVWIRTHRVAAWVWTVGSLLGFVAVMAGLSVLWALAVFLVMALFPVVYSLVLYKHLQKHGKLSGSVTSNGPQGSS